MSKKNLLQENTVRRFMQLAGNQKYSKTFINETWLPESAGIDETDSLMEEEFDVTEGGGMYEDDLEEGMGMYEDDLEEQFSLADIDSLAPSDEYMGDDVDPFADDMSGGGDPFMMSESRMRRLFEQEDMEDMEDMEPMDSEEEPEGEEEPESGDVDVEIEEADVNCLKTARDVLSSIIGAAEDEAGAEDDGGEEDFDLDMGGEEAPMGGEEAPMGGEEAPMEDEEAPPALQEITNEVLRRVTRRLLRSAK